MSLMGLLILLVIAAIAGSLGQALSGYSVGGCLMSIVVGFIGSVPGALVCQNLTPARTPANYDPGRNLSPYLGDHRVSYILCSAGFPVQETPGLVGRLIPGLII